jgi:hypothetical protein
LFNIGLSAYFDMKRFAEESLERRSMAGRGPELELGVPGCTNLQQRVRATVVKLDTRNRLGVAAVEALCQSEDGRERSHHLPALARQLPESFMLALRGRAAMVACDERNRVDFLRFEST